MGNRDGLMEAMANFGNNSVYSFDGGYFSFAFENEIALKLDSYDGYFILNCDYRLWEEVKNHIRENTTISEAAIFWLEKRMHNPINIHSRSFDKLERYAQLVVQGGNKRERTGMEY